MYALFIKYGEFKQKVTGQSHELLTYSGSFAIVPSKMLMRILIEDFAKESYKLNSLYIQYGCRELMGASEFLALNDK